MYQPDLVFISEPQTYQMDIQHHMYYFQDHYRFYLNSEDLHDHDLPMLRNKAKGGTMVMWRSHLDPFTTVPKPSSPAFLPIILKLPNLPTTIHVALYLPTAGKETEYLTELAKLKTNIIDLQLQFPNSAIFIRGDANSSKTNPRRSSIFHSFCKDLNLLRVDINHNTYHHFVGNGGSDSELDVLLYSDQDFVKECLLSLHCQHQDPRVDSHHDLLVSSSSIALNNSKTVDKSDNITAPRVENNRQKIIWSDGGIAMFEGIVSVILPSLRSRWQSSNSQSAASVLIQCTNFLLNQVAAMTNKVINLGSPVRHRAVKTPKCIRKSGNFVAKAHSELRNLLENQCSVVVLSAAKSKLIQLKRNHRKLVRYIRHKQNIARDSKIKPKQNNINHAVRHSRQNVSTDVHELHVGDKLYEGDCVPDGIYDSISSLKSLDETTLSQSLSFQDASQVYEAVLKICKSGSKIPPISLSTAEKILASIRPSVSDINSITGLHYKYGGKAGLEHFMSLLNTIIQDLNNLALEELNLVWASILYKGHDKDRTLDRSYRTISTCPLLSKAIDCYISMLYSSKWTSLTAQTQFQQQSSSHELAALTLSETITHSVNTLSRPAYVIYLDAQSAFDLALKEFIVSNLYHYGVQDQGLIAIDQRLKHRKTICQWNRIMMGPIRDECGVEQGGKNSSDFYKVYNDEQLNQAQASGFGVPLGPVIVSAIGQADDVALIANDLQSLQGLVDLSISYCMKYHVTISSEKTKLQVYTSKSSELEAFLGRETSLLNINGSSIAFVDETEHVGVKRSIHGNLPHLLNRLAAHRKSMFSILPIGLGKKHRGNPSVSIIAHSIYCLPVLFSGLSALTLKSTEIDILDQYIKTTLERLQKLRVRTPLCVVMFLGGHLPGKAILHFKLLTIFGMVCRLQNSFINKIARYQLTTAKPSSGSWFLQIRNLCLKYSLPSALTLLQYPPTKQKYRTLVKAKIVDFWETSLRAQALSMQSKSLRFFKAEYMSLTRPHPIWSSCGSNPYEINKAIVQARMLSGRYVTDQLARHWRGNTNGMCTIPSCPGTEAGSLEHLLLFCPALDPERAQIRNLCLSVALESSDLHAVIHSVLGSTSVEIVMQFLLDCSSLPAVIKLKQASGDKIIERLFYLTRTWCYNMHRSRLTKLGLQQYI